jgi:hypothetical protein
MKTTITNIQTTFLHGSMDEQVNMEVPYETRGFGIVHRNRQSITTFGKLTHLHCLNLLASIIIMVTMF